MQLLKTNFSSNKTPKEPNISPITKCYKLFESLWSIEIKSFVIVSLLPDLPAKKNVLAPKHIRTKMAAAVPKWLMSAQGDLTASNTDDQKEKTKAKNKKRYEARKRRIARKREAKMAKLRMAMEEQIDKMQVDTRELIQEEKERSKRFLSLARKYYGMWKTLNEKCRENSVWKLQRSQVQYSKSNVSFGFASGKHKRHSTSCFKSSARKFKGPRQLVKCNHCHFWQIRCSQSKV